MRKRMTSIATAGLATVLSLSVTLSQPSLAEAATKSKPAATKSKAAASKPTSKLVVKPKPVATPKPIAAPKPAVAKPAPTAKVTTTAVVLSESDTRLLAFVDSVMARLRSTAPVGAAPGTWKGSGVPEARQLGAHGALKTPYRSFRYGTEAP